MTAVRSLTRQLLCCAFALGGLVAADPPEDPSEPTLLPVSTGDYNGPDDGNFTMGDLDESDDIGASDELPAHGVTLSAFQLSNEITRVQLVEALQWAHARTDATQIEVDDLDGDGLDEVCFADDGEKHILVDDLGEPGGDEPPSGITWDATNEQFAVYSGIGPDLPAVQVTWYGAMAYCRIMNKALGKGDGVVIDFDVTDGDGNALPQKWEIRVDSTGYRLPTEAEWECAAMGEDIHGSGGGSGRLFPTGSEVPAAGEVNFSYYESGLWDQTPATESNGLSNMAGNVWEWCYDWYGIYPAGHVDGVADPSGLVLGPKYGYRRVLRGGSFKRRVWDIRCKARHSAQPEVSSESIGFRVAVGQ
ncbi:MAG: formylglycine-generating enzyme family protein [Planctomycetota bacterium]